MSVPVDSASEKKIRSLNYDNSWNRDGLLASRKDVDSEVIVCPHTEIELYFHREDGTRIDLEAHGECYNCQRIVHKNALKFPDGVAGASYPVRYVCYWCRECNELPESEWRETKEMLAGLNTENSGK